MFFSYIALYKHMNPLGMASLEPRGLISRTYVGATKHNYTLNIYAVGLKVSEKIFLKFFLYKSMGANAPGAWLV